MKQIKSWQCSEPMGLHELTPKPAHSTGGHHWDTRDVKYQPWYLLNKVRSRNADNRSVPERQYGEDLLSFLQTLTLFTHRPNGRDCSHLHWGLPQKSLTQMHVFVKIHVKLTILCILSLKTIYSLFSRSINYKYITSAITCLAANTIYVKNI